MNKRNSWALTTLLGTVGLLFFLAGAAEAVTCNSTCNQVRRACNGAAKGAYKAGKIQCDEDRDACKADCVANADTCLGDCELANLVGDALLQCQDDCINCEANCDAAKDQCRVDNKAARDLLRSACTDSRDVCDDVCVDPIDGNCVRDCKRDEHGCRDDAKRIEGQCKKACPKDGARKSCIRTCRKDGNVAQGVCGDLSVLCYAGCAGVDLTPPTTLP